MAMPQIEFNISARMARSAGHLAKAKHSFNYIIFHK